MSVECVCEKCGRGYAVWYADDPLWNSVVGDSFHFLCMDCFALMSGAHFSPWYLRAHIPDTHNTGIGSLDCWCMPRYLRPCDECGVEIKASVHCDELATGGPKCWKCEGGTVELTREEAGSADFPLIIVHKDQEG